LRGWEGSKHIKDAQAGMFNMFKGMESVREVVNT
jgi:hypothetical protein